MPRRRVRRIEFPIAAAILAAGLQAPASALPLGEEKVRVVTTLAVLKEIAREVGGDDIEVDNLADPRQDPHYVQPTPTLMKKAREADLLIEVGLDLELWAQKVADGAANPKIQAGQPGRLIASAGVPTLELPVAVSREWGDIHPYGNPHIWLDPIRARKIAENIADALGRVDPARRQAYADKLAAFEEKIDLSLFGADLVKTVGASRLGRLAQQGRLGEYLKEKGLESKLGGWLKKAEPLRGKEIVTFHKSWVYFADRFGFTIPIEIEDKPGIPPSAKHRDRVIALMREHGIKAIVNDAFYDRTAADYIARETGARVVVVPIEPGGTPGVDTYFSLIDHVLESLAAAVQEGAQ